MNPYKLTFLPLWGPFWLLDKLFKLGIYSDVNNDIKKKKIKIGFEGSKKFILLKLTNKESIDKILNSYIHDPILERLNYGRIEADFEICNLPNSSIIQVQNITFRDYVGLLTEFHYYSTPARNFQSKGIIIDPQHLRNSLYLEINLGKGYDYVGRTARHKKICLNIDDLDKFEDTVYINHELEQVKRFKFKNFNNNLSIYRFKKISNSQIITY